MFRVFCLANILTLALSASVRKEWNESTQKQTGSAVQHQLPGRHRRDSDTSRSYLTPQDFLNAASSDVFAADISSTFDESDPGYFDPLLEADKFEGDINLNGLSILSLVDDLVIADPDADESVKQKVLAEANAIRGLYKIWPEGKIPYKVSSEFNTGERSVIAAAISEYNAKTCIRWVPQTTEYDYVYFIKDRGCYSNVGKSGGEQVISLGANCVYKGIVIHEMMHAVGFFHEQSRSDRDNYVRINWDNIISSTKSNFNKYSQSMIDHLGTEYDYDSIMHYGKTDFAKSFGLNTIEPLYDGVTIGQRRGLSENDALKLNKLYNCEDVGGKGPLKRTTTPKPVEYTTTEWIVDTTTDEGGYYTTEDPEVCEDTIDEAHCQMWKDFGQCDDWNFQSAMEQCCPKTCEFCGDYYNY